MTDKDSLVLCQIHIGGSNNWLPQHALCHVLNSCISSGIINIKQRVRHIIFIGEPIIPFWIYRSLQDNSATRSFALSLPPFYIPPFLQALFLTLNIKENVLSLKNSKPDRYSWYFCVLSLKARLHWRFLLRFHVNYWRFRGDLNRK